MRLGEFKGFSDWLAGTEIGSDAIWQKDHAEVTELDIQLFYRRAHERGQRGAAIDAIDRLQAAVITAAFNRVIPQPSAAIVLHELPTPRFLVDELVAGLGKMSVPRRQACLFALEMKVRPESVTTMMWSDVLTSGMLEKLTPLARELCEKAQQTRHIKLPYVFWEWASKEIAAPLLQLQRSAETAFDCSWPQLVNKYGQLVLLDRSADSASVQDLLAQFHP